MPITVIVSRDANVLILRFLRKKKSVATHDIPGERNEEGDVGRKGFPCDMEEDKF